LEEILAMSSGYLPQPEVEHSSSQLVIYCFWDNFFIQMSKLISSMKNEYVQTAKKHMSKQYSNTFGLPKDAECISENISLLTIDDIYEYEYIYTKISEYILIPKY
jgi:hypothetical protein